jgi:hypothetical protein
MTDGGSKTTAFADITTGKSRKKATLQEVEQPAYSGEERYILDLSRHVMVLAMISRSVFGTGELPILERLGTPLETGTKASLI